MPELVRTFFISLPGEKKSVSNAQSQEVYFIYQCQLFKCKISGGVSIEYDFFEEPPLWIDIVFFT